MHIKITSIFYVILIIIISSVSYTNIIKNEFVWDDPKFVSWAGAKDFNDIYNFFKGEVPEGHGGVYRPLRSIFYVISYKLWKLNPVGYHLQSILIHLISTILIYFIVLNITEKRIIGFMSALLFGVHPIHTETITSITGSFDIIGVIFFLISFYLYLKASSSENQYNIKYVLSIIFALFAFLTYELTLTLPLLIILYEFCFKKIKKKGIIRKIKAYSLYFVIMSFYFFTRYIILKVPGRANYLANSFYFTMLTMTKAFLKYILLVLFPISPNVNHTISEGILSLAYADFNEKAILAQSLFDLHILFATAVIAVLFIIAIKSFNKYPIVSFCIGWFFIGLAPVLNIIPQGSILSEKYLYISSFGFCLLFSYGIHQIYNITHNKMKYVKVVLILFFIITTIAYSMQTFSRNKDWKNELTLWSKTVEQSPNSALAHNNIGVVYQKQGNIDLAIDVYKQAIALNPNYAEAYNNLGLVYQSQGKTKLAVEAYQKALALNQNPAFHNNLGIAYQIQGKLELAIEEYKKALSIQDNYASHNNLAIAYYNLGKKDIAIEEYKKALKINPNYLEAHKNVYFNYDTTLGNISHKDANYS